MVVVMMVMAVGLLLHLLGGSLLYLAHPRGRRSYRLVVEQPRVYQLRKVHVGVVALYDFCLGLYGSDYSLDAAGLLGCNFRYFVEQDDVAELYLLYHKVFDVVLVDVLCRQGVAAAEFAFEPQGVDHGAYAVEAGHAAALIALFERGHRTYCPRNGLGLAYAAGLDHDVVESAGSHEVAKLLHEVHFQGAAYAAVLQGHEVARIGASHHAAFLNEVGVDVYLAYIVDYHGKFYTAFVGENTVKKRSFAAAQIARQQQHGNIAFHIYTIY